MLFVKRNILRLLTVFLASVLMVAGAMQVTSAEEITGSSKGTLVIIGGNLETNNAEIYNKMIELAGGKEKAVIGIFPTASGSMTSSNSMKQDFEAYGIPADHVRIIDITEKNYPDKVNNESVAGEIAKCTGLFFIGGDQSRITKAFYNQDGTNTKALDAVWKVFKGGGMIGGTSAGAAIMSTPMILNATSLEAFQLGVTYEGDKPGLWVTKGLGFFEGGITDQHFSKRGRIGRLVVALMHEKMNYGFGIDENSAMVVKDSEIQVIGASGMFLIDVSKATATKSGAYNNVDVSYLEKGDRYNFTTKQFTLDKSKTLIPQGKEYYEGNALNTNIFGSDAAKAAILDDLADNTEKQSRGLTFSLDKKNKGKGVTVVFSKTSDTKGYYDETEYASSVLHVRMDILPIEVEVKELK